MRIRMLRTSRGSDDGVTLRTYEAGQEYELPDTPRGLDLAQVFIEQMWAEPTSAPTAPPSPAAPPGPEVALAAVPEHVDAPPLPPPAPPAPTPNPQKRRR